MRSEPTELVEGLLQRQSPRGNTYLDRQVKKKTFDEMGGRLFGRHGLKSVLSPATLKIKTALLFTYKQSTFFQQ